ncbi:MAG: plasmid pRiA4b ORF-3 family protein [Anaerolineae bacterium]|nr:plasmid pRiA4b ORF-3 family protein [Anaerolineae bacterium]
MNQTQPAKIYQFKITLKGVKPSVWRRIQVPDTYSFWDLHVAIQDAMGWSDSHLHQFEIANPKTQENVLIGITDDDFDWSRATLRGWEAAITDYFTLDNRVAGYEYDFGDGWQHRIRLEAIKQADSELDYPRCVAGAQACPPEDIGGVWGYQDFVKIIRDPNDAQYQDFLEWVGGAFDPDYFDPEDVWFDNPEERWKFAFRG